MSALKDVSDIFDKFTALREALEEAKLKLLPVRDYNAIGRLFAGEAGENAIDLVVDFLTDARYAYKSKDS